MNYILILMLPLLSALLINCNRTTGDAPGSTVAKDQSVSSPAYPHGKEFMRDHGQKYLTAKDQCLACHGNDGGGGTTNVACTSCHQNFPHPENWAMPNKHSVNYMKNPQGCAQCHGQDYQGGKTKISCNQCHKYFPHDLGWGDPSLHGKKFESLTDKSECLTCHDANNKSSLATRCDTCHSAYPHSQEFEGGQGDHPKLAKTYAGQCAICHRNFKENMPNYSDTGCLTCHEGNLTIQWVAPPPPPTPSPAPKPSSLNKSNKSLRVPSSTKKSRARKPSIPKPTTEQSL